ncbi:hypothetical protein PJO48_29735, partial [Mycobacterium kansasii]
QAIRLGNQPVGAALTVGLTSMFVLYIHAVHPFFQIILRYGPTNEIDTHLRWTTPHETVVIERPPLKTFKGPP